MSCPCIKLVGFFCLAIIGQVANAQTPPQPLPYSPEGSIVETVSVSSTLKIEEQAPVSVASACDTCSGNSSCQNSCCSSKLIPRLKRFHSGYNFNDRPFGSYYYQIQHAHIASGMAKQLVLYQYDFKNEIQASHTLNEYGEAQLGKLAERVMRLGQPVVIQKSPQGPELDEKRRAHVVTQLAKHEISADMVVVQRVLISGLGAAGETMGNQSQWNMIYQNRLIQTRDQGNSRIGQSFSQ
ncbi:MAG: hypothetical protein COA78_09255 [Blastopirellula sp.]|nr:MAG: hypothetical protein COA78_09255 [Blastopirellula sp.]